MSFKRVPTLSQASAPPKLPLRRTSRPPRIYLLGIGSNVHPTQHVPLAVEKLLAHSSRCVLSRAIQTEPVGMLSSHQFLNLVAYLEIDLNPLDLKTFLNRIEADLGRDRTDPQRKVKDRTIDLDILTEIQSHEDYLKAIIESPDYCRSILFELITTLSHDLSRLEPITVPLKIGDVSCGHQPTRLPAEFALAAAH